MPELRKKVLLVSALPPPNGGVASWTQTILDNGLPNNFVTALVNTRMPTGRRLFDSEWNPLREAKRLFAILFELARAIAVEKPDVIHVNSSMAKRGIFRDLACVLIGRASRRPVVVQYRGDVGQFMLENPRGFQKRVMRLMAHLATRNVVLNSSSRELLRTFMRNGDGPPLLIVNYIDDSVVRNAVAVPGRMSGRPRILFVGGLAREKGTYDTLELAKRIPEADFVLVGCPSRDLALPSDLPTNFIQRGELTRAQTFEEFSAAHIFLFPSYSEGFPNAVLEAMAAGLPVVASTAGAIPDMVLESGGMLLPPGDVDGFTGSIRKLLGDAELRTSYGEFNRSRVLTTYLYSRVSKELTDIYESVMPACGTQAEG